MELYLGGAARTPKIVRLTNIQLVFQLVALHTLKEVFRSRNVFLGQFWKCENYNLALSLIILNEYSRNL